MPRKAVGWWERAEVWLLTSAWVVAFLAWAGMTIWLIVGGPR